MLTNMINTFIKTSKGIICRESITFIEINDKHTLRLANPDPGETAIRIHFSSSSVVNSSLILQGKEAEAFLQIIPIAADFTYLSKGKLPEPEADGRRD